MIYLFIFLVLWAITSVITYGAFLGWYQREFDHIASDEYARDVSHAFFMSIFPFAGFMVALLLNRFEHGLKYKKYD